jgi:chromate transporter
MPHGISFRDALRLWLKVAALSFGGPAGQIAVMHRLVVEEKRWVSENRFLHALNYCMFLPGPEAHQLSIYLGWLLHGWRGGLAAGVLFVLPGFLSILILSVLYATLQGHTAVEALFFGIKPAVMAIVLEAVIRIGGKALKTASMGTLAAAAFIAIYFFQVPFPWIIAASALIGFLGGRWWPAQFEVIRPADSGDAGEPEALLHDGNIQAMRPSLARGLRVGALWLALWWLPVLGLLAWLGTGDLFVQQGLFFSKVALVSFGGAYSVLAYVAQQAVQIHGWLLPGEMLDGLGMAETTPGPLIQVVQFVGFLGAYRQPGILDPVTAGVLASILVTWVTFVPSFLWIFLGAPYIEHMRGNRALNSALSGITAAVVGVILNLALWFGIHTLFAEFDQRRIAGMTLQIPDWHSMDIAATLLAAAAFVAIFRFRLGMVTTIGLSVLAGGAYFLLIRAG